MSLLVTGPKPAYRAAPSPTPPQESDKPDLSALEVETASPVAASLREQELNLKIVCLMIANGETPEATAKKSGNKLEWVRKVIGSPVGMDLIIRLQHESNPDPQVRIRKMASIALDAQTRLLLSPSTPHSVLAKVSNDVADRAFGKAIQVTENRNLNFDLKDARKLDDSIRATEEKLKRIADMQKKLALPVGQSDAYADSIKAS